MYPSTLEKELGGFMHESALTALYTAADAIRKCPDVAEATVDNDNDSGEIIFALSSGENYVLKLEELELAVR